MTKKVGVTKAFKSFFGPPQRILFRSGEDNLIAPLISASPELTYFPMGKLYTHGYPRTQTIHRDHESVAIHFDTQLTQILI